MGLWRISVYAFVFERVCSHIRMGVLETGLYVYGCAGVEGMCTFKTGNSSNKGLCLC